VGVLGVPITHPFKNDLSNLKIIAWLSLMFYLLKFVVFNMNISYNNQVDHLNLGLWYKEVTTVF
ncbi:hypothetical protein, partial [Salmonella enterica]|uniref:hypothetical protein n=1 Tax=Salmonella enterica TaxID=28901 RepID=UPI0020C43989